jgi:ferredoxin
MSGLFLVRFEPNEVAVPLSPRANLLEGARRAGIQLASNCNGQGECGECCVVILEGQVSPIRQEELDLLSPAELAQGWRLACCTQAYGPGRVRVVGPLRRSSDGGQSQHQDP